MDNIEKKICLETAKNRLNGVELPTLSGTSFVYDIKFEDINNVGYAKTIPLVKNSNGETILRYKNLMDKYYWLVNKFIPSCEYYKYCYRNGENIWIRKNDLYVLRGECFITFKDWDGTFINSVMVLKGNTYTPDPSITPSREGYDFQGWIGYDFTQPIEEDVTVYADYDVQQRTVTFIYYEGTSEVTNSVSVNYGSDVPSESIPDPNNYDGHTFNEWSGSYTNVTEDRTIIAQYSINEFTVLFYVDDEYYARYDVNYGELAEKPQDPTKYYNTFNNWVISGTTQVFDFEHTPITENYILTADFIPEEYIITFIDWNGTVISVETGVTHETIIVVEDHPERYGYTFDKWSWPDSDSGDTDYTMTGFVSDTTVVAQYKALQLHVKFMLLDINEQWSTYQDATYDYNGRVTMPNEPSEREYDPYTFGIFDGWYKDSDFLEEYNFDETQTTDNLEIYGKWKNEFEVTFYNWNNTLITGSTEEEFANPQIVRYGEDAVVPKSSFILPNGNFAFIGWSVPTTNITNDTIIKAVFSNTRVWTVTFVNTLTEEVLGTAYVENGSDVRQEDIPTVPETYGYTFSNWSNSLVGITSNITASTVYNPVSFVVTYIDHDGNELTTLSQNYLTNGRTPSGIEVSDFEQYEYDETRGYNVLCPYTFSGEYWLIGEDTGITPEMTVITGDTTFQAHYVKSGPCQDITFEVIINRFDGAYYTTLYNKHYGDYLTANEVNVIRNAVESSYTPPQGLIFYGLEDQDGNKYRYDDDFPIMITGPITFRLFYMIPVHRVNYISSLDNSIISSQEIAENSVILSFSVPQAPTVPNYEWVTNGTNTLWYTEPECINLFDFNTHIMGDTNLYAKYIRRFNIDIQYLTENDE